MELLYDMVKDPNMEVVASSVMALNEILEVCGDAALHPRMCWCLVMYVGDV